MQKTYWPLLTFFSLVLCTPLNAQTPAQHARNPILWADVPDVSVLRVGETYYMASTTMHMAPGVPIMTSSNLVDWTMAGYVYDVMAQADALNMHAGQNAYGRGSWASSLRYHDGTFYLATFSYSLDGERWMRVGDTLQMCYTLGATSWATDARCSPVPPRRRAVLPTSITTGSRGPGGPTRGRGRRTRHPAPLMPGRYGGDSAGRLAWRARS
jgi:hypothetical protein